MAIQPETGIPFANLSDIEQLVRGSSAGASEPVLRTVIRFLTGQKSRCESALVEFKAGFNRSTKAWVTLLAEAAALTNSGGGILVYGVGNDGERLGVEASLIDDLDPAKIHDQLRKFAQGATLDVQALMTTYRRRHYLGLFLAAGHSIVSFDRDGNYQNDRGNTESAFRAGVIYVRWPGGKRPATQLELNQVMQRLSDIQARNFLAKIERVVTLPQDAELIAVSPGDHSRGARLIGEGRGLPVRIVQADDQSAIPVAEILDPDLPFVSMQAEVSQQVRLWRSVDPQYRIPRSTLALWFARRDQCEWSEDACELVVRSALRCRGYPVWWAGRLGEVRAEQLLHELIQENAYPDREALPYVIGATAWEKRLALWSKLLEMHDRFSPVSSTIGRLTELNVVGFRLAAVRPSPYHTRDGEILRIEDALKVRVRAEAVLTEIITADGISTEPSAARGFARQLDIALFGRAPVGLSLPD